MTEFEIVIVVAVGIGILLLLLFLRYFDDRSNRQQIDETRRQANQEEVQRFVARMNERGTIPTRQVDVILRSGEFGIFQEPSTLMEVGTFRLYGGAGKRIGGIFVGGGASDTQQRLKTVDSGSLVLTSERLIFDGQKQNRAVKLSDILSVSEWSDAIEVSTAKRQKSQIYTVQNPSLWRIVSQSLASAKHTAEA